MKDVPFRPLTNREREGEREHDNADREVSRFMPILDTTSIKSCTAAFSHLKHVCLRLLSPWLRFPVGVCEGDGLEACSYWFCHLFLTWSCALPGVQRKRGIARFPCMAAYEMHWLLLKACRGIHPECALARAINVNMSVTVTLEAPVRISVPPSKPPASASEAGAAV